ncbi:MAG: hypothetical protein ACE5J2_08220 [Nitrososphaerales archaeon]
MSTMISSAPAEAIEELIDDVNAMELPKGVKTSLTAPLGNAVKLLTDDNPKNDKAVCGKLGAFINQVDAKEKSGKLTTAQAAELRNAAEGIKDSLGCT